MAIFLYQGKTAGKICLALQGSSGFGISHDSYISHGFARSLLGVI